MRRSVLVAALAISTPASLAVETAIRTVLFTDDMKQLRTWVGPFLTPYAWVLLAVTVAATVLSPWLHRALHRRAVTHLGERRDDPAARASVDTVTLYIASSVVQLPTLLSTMLFTMGAAFWPVFVALCVAGAGVVIIAWLGAAPWDASPRPSMAGTTPPVRGSVSQR
jgi:hypothetical protein